MPTVYTWTYPSNLRLPTSGEFTNVVTAVNYMCSANDGTHTAETRSLVELPEPSEPFIEYDDLTFEIVDGWVKAVLGAEAVAAIEASLQGHLDTLADPPAFESATFPF